MKKLLSVALSAVMTFSVLSVGFTANAAQSEIISFNTRSSLYVHAVSGADDTQAWQGWQSKHDNDFNVIDENVKYFFLPSSADDESVEIYNAFSQDVSVNGTKIGAGESETVSYNINENYSVNAEGKTYTLKFMKSTAEAAIYINNSNADGNGTELAKYLNADKNRSATAEGAIVGKDGSVNNTSVKKIKGRGNTSWDKAKKGYNVTYTEKVSIAGMSSSKKYSMLPNYQDDSLLRNRFLYDLSDAVGMPYASDSRFVDFYMNGYYWGSYLMAEKVEAGKSSLVNDVSEDDYLNEDGTVKEDFPFVCEVDASAGGDDYYVDSSSGNKLTIKCPELSSGDPGYKEVKNYVKKKFDAFFNAAKSSAETLSDYADIESITKLYLINEYGKNWDSGVSSTFFTYKQDENGIYKFYGSPVWDYDNSLGNAVGVEGDLQHFGVNDYTEYSGWWCKYKGRRNGSKSSSNIINNLARNKAVLEAAPSIWFEDFVPALENFANGIDTDELYSTQTYYNLLKGTADMNYTSGWLLYTGGWIADHSKLNTSSFDMKTGNYTVSGSQKNYNKDFKGMYDYCIDWATSRAAWLSNAMYEDYTPPVKTLLGDADKNGIIDVSDVTTVQRYAAKEIDFDEQQIENADVGKSGVISVNDATLISRYVAKMITSF